MWDYKDCEVIVHEEEKIELQAGVDLFVLNSKLPWLKLDTYEETTHRFTRLFFFYKRARLKRSNLRAWRYLRNCFEPLLWIVRKLEAIFLHSTKQANSDSGTVLGPLLFAVYATSLGPIICSHGFFIPLLSRGHTVPAVPLGWTLRQDLKPCPHR